MNFRMDKYNKNEETLTRVDRNKDLYSFVDMSDLEKIKTNNNVSVISDSGKDIDLNKIKNYLNALNDEDKDRRTSIKLETSEEEDVQEKPEQKDYDINSVLERARKGREINYSDQRYKKIDEKEYDILKRIKTEVKEEKEDLFDELNTGEKTIVNFINDINQNVSNKKDELFKDLMGDNENTVILGVDDLKEGSLEDITRELENISKPLNDVTQDLLLEQERLKALIKDDTDTVDILDVDEMKELSMEDNLNTSQNIDIKKVEVKEDKNDKIVNIDKSFFTNSFSFKKSDFFNHEEEDSGSSYYTKFAIAMLIIILITTIVLVLNYVFEFNWF